MTRPRLLWFLLILLVIGLGLFLRSTWLAQGFFTKYGGDALWALVVFLGWGWLWPRAATWRVALLAIAFSALIECSQLVRADWLDALRATLPGRLVLGSTFAWADLLAYLVGIAAGALAEWLPFRRHCTASPG